MKGRREQPKRKRVGVTEEAEDAGGKLRFQKEQKKRLVSLQCPLRNTWGNGDTQEKNGKETQREKELWVGKGNF